MKTGEKLLLVALGAAGGYVAAKYGKQIVATVKENSDREHLEAIAKDIKESSKKVADSVKKSADSIKKSVEDLRYEAEKAMYADLGDFDDIEDYFMCKAEEEVEVEHEPVVVPNVDTIPVVEPVVAETVTAESVVDEVKEDKKASNVQSAAEVLKKRRNQYLNKSKTKKTVKVEDAEPAKEEVKTEPVEDKAE